MRFTVRLCRVRLPPQRRPSRRKSTMNRIVHGPEVVKWVADKTGERGNFGCAVGIGLERSGVLIAGVVYADYNGVNMVCHIASDGSKRWMTRQYLWTIFDYPFNKAKVNRITVCVLNEDSRRLVEHMGFTFEANLQNAQPNGDILIYRLFRDSCRFLKHENLYPHRLRMAA